MNSIDQNIIFANNEKKAKDLISQIREESPTFLCVAGNTETAKIPGISMAGKDPEYTDYTPTADLEILTHGKPKSIEEVPATPSGIPTPAIITKCALDLGEISSFCIDAGLRVKPQIPTIDLGGSPGRSIKEEVAVPNPERIFKNGKLMGKSLGNLTKYLVIGETIPGGTTSALGVLKAMGVEAEGMVSSSMPENPHTLKLETVREGLKSSGLTAGVLEGEPLSAVSAMGDPMIPALAGLATGYSKKGIVMLAGGTQMVAVLKVLEGLEEESLNRTILGTTRWILEDKQSNLTELVEEVGEVPVLAADLDFSGSKFEGLKAYEEGYVKEGVGAGGASIGAFLNNESLNNSSLLKNIEKVYEELLG